ncbi:COMM domain-containing protein 5, partial [Thecamonas trahens ATCC 50062]
MSGEVEFLGTPLPLEVKNAMPLMRKVPGPAFTALLQGVVLGTEVPESVMAALGPDAVDIVYTALQVIVDAAVRLQVKTIDFQTAMRNLNMPDAYIKTMSKVLRAKRSEMIASRLDSRISYPSIKRLRWRVDVAISTSAMTRVLKPAILMELSLSDGSKKQFEVSQEKFNDLRYNVALLLKGMEDVEGNVIMKSKKDTLKR